MHVEQTKTVAQIVASLSPPYNDVNPYLLFAANGVPEIRQACLKAMDRWPLVYGDLLNIELIATTLQQRRDPLWKEFMQGYLFCRGDWDIHRRAIGFLLESCRGKDPELSRFRSKAMYGRLERALYYHEASIYELGREFVHGELQFFHDWCKKHNFYQDDEWYRLERAVKLLMRAQGWTAVGLLRSIVHLYRPRKNPLHVSWTATSDLMYPIIREQHLAFLRGAIKYLEPLRRKHERTSEQVLA